jgi:hypothetical protein
MLIVTFLLFSRIQDDDSNMLRVQLANHEPSSGFSLERRQRMGRLDARTSKIHFNDSS